MSEAPFDHPVSLRRLGEEHFDVLVIGGGITGCGVALDAAERGLKVALVEARDFGSGTSSKSSKLVHGGLRYLQQRDFRLVYEALRERQRLLRNAPHLVHPLPFLIPLFGTDGVVNKGLAKAYSSTLWTYDVTGGLRIGRRHERIDRARALRHLPLLRTDRLVAAFLYWDAQADDARLTLAVARSAARRGAVLANYCAAEGLVEEAGRVVGARLVDGTVVRATTVVNASGVWAQAVERLGGGDEASIAIRPAKGIHVTVPSEKLPCDVAAVFSVPGDRRSIFVVPWAADEAEGTVGPGRFTYIGTTDTDYEGSLDDPLCTPEDIEYLLGAVNAWTTAGLTPADVTATWAGLRPLISDARSARTADLSRRHTVVVSPDGVVTVTGGKLTTYRKMAADTIDAVLDGTRSGDRSRPRSRFISARWARWATGNGPAWSATAKLRLVGGDAGGSPPADTPARAAELGIAGPTYAHLRGRHGSCTGDVLAICEGRPRLAEPISAALPYLKAEVVYAVRHEMARTLLDILARRTRALILDRSAALAVAAEVADLAGDELGWDRDERQRQVAEVAASVQAEVAAETAGMAS